MSDTVPSPAEKAAERALALLGTPSRLAAMAGERHQAALTDLFRSDNQRLSEQQISIMQRMMRRVLATIEADLRARLVADPGIAGEEAMIASLGSEHVPIAMPILGRAGLLQDRDFVGELLRRSDEFLLLSRLGDIGFAAETNRLADLVDQSDSALAEAAMTLLVAEARGNDRFGDPVLAVADLPDNVRQRLYWLVAAALREYGVRHHAPQMTAFDVAVETAGTEAIAAGAPEISLETAAMELTQALDRTDQLDDGLLAEAMANGRLALYAAIIAMRADIPFEAAWSMALSGDATSHAVVLRACDVPVPLAQALIDTAERASGRLTASDEAVGEAIAGYEDLASADAKAALYPWRFERGYRQAVDAISGAER